MAKAVKYLRYDALVVGNHEFDWGVEQLRAFYLKAEIPVLSAGIELPENKPCPGPGRFLSGRLTELNLSLSA